MVLRLFKLMISCLFFGVSRILRTIVGLTGRKPAPTLTALTYHLVTEKDRDAFIRQIKFLLKAGHAVDAGNLPAFEAGRHYVAVTFDDGYAVCIPNAIEECRKRGIPVTAFIPSEFLGRKPDWITDDYADFQGQRIVNEKELKDMADLPVTIGSHTATHCRLTALDAGRLRDELVGSRTRLESIAGRPVTILSFPFGSYGDAVVKAAKQAGYERVMLTIPTFPASSVDRFLLGRTDISCNDWPIEYRLKIMGGYHWQAIASGLKDFLLRRRKLAIVTE